MFRRWDLGMVGAALLGVAMGLVISGSLDIMNRTSADEQVNQAERAKLKKEIDELARSSQAFTQTFPKLAKLIGPSVVTVYTEGKVKKTTTRKFRVPKDLQKNMPWWLDKEIPWEQFEQRLQPSPQPRRGMGSGVIVDEGGDILTNNHVVQGMKGGQIKVKLYDGRKYDAEVVATDPKTDLAVIKIKAGGLVPAKFGDSRKTEVGEWVVTVGAPFGLERSISAGIISAKGRRDVSIVRNDFRHEDFLQTDAAVNPGNSGGPLVNLHGEVIGICTAIATRSGGDDGVGFAIPSDIAKNVMRQLIDKKKVVRGYLGVGMFGVTEDARAQMSGFKDSADLRAKLKLNSTDGVYVAEVRSGSPAEAGGIEPEDVIVEFDGVKITDSHSLSDVVRNTPVGKKVKVGIIRDGKHIDLDFTVGEQPDGTVEVTKSKKDEDAHEVPALGITVAEVTPELAEKYDLDDEKGVVVTERSRGSLPFHSLREGDLIQKVNGQTITTVAEFEKAIQPFAKGELIKLIVRNKTGLRAVRLQQTKE